MPFINCILIITINFPRNTRVIKPSVEKWQKIWPPAARSSAIPSIPRSDGCLVPGPSLCHCHKLSKQSALTVAFPAILSWLLTLNTLTSPDLKLIYSQQSHLWNLHGFFLSYHFKTKLIYGTTLTKHKRIFYPPNN